MEAIQSMASAVLVNLVLGVITLLGAYGVYYIQKATAKVKAQTAQLEDQTSRELFQNAIEDVDELATVTVGAIEQTTAAALREAVKDGKIDRKELLALGKKAFNEVKAKVAAETRWVIAENLGSFDEYLSNLIEMKVLEIKASTSM